MLNLVSNPKSTDNANTNLSMSGLRTPKGNYLCTDDLAKLKKMKDIAVANKDTTHKYKNVDTADIVQSVGDYLTEQGHEFTTKILLGAAKKSSKHIAEFTITNMDLLPEDGGGNGKILVINSYNGECSLYLLAGAIRFACANGIISGTKEFFEKIIHRDGMLLTEKMMMLNEKVQIACEYLKEHFADKVTAMMEQNINFTKECEIVLGLNIPNQAKLDVIAKIHPTNRHMLRVEDQPQNTWTLFNIINESIREAARHAVSELEYNENLMDNVVALAA